MFIENDRGKFYNIRRNKLSKTNVNSEHKDRLFNYIFGREENKKWTLNLYNAINGSNYTDPNLITFNTLENFLYLSMRNDTSFIISESINLYEHQGSYNPNMPLRMLEYLGRLYGGYVKQNDLDKFGTQMIKLPVPKLVTFYNGTKETEDVVQLKLTDSFDRKVRDQSDVEVKVTMYNINHGRNSKLMEVCKPLAEYSWLMAEIRNNISHIKDVEFAVSKAIDDMPEKYEIRKFLVVHKTEVANMLLAEWNEQDAIETIRKTERNEGRKEGRREGRREGIKEGLEIGINGTVEILRSTGMDDESIITKISEQYNLSYEKANTYL